MATAEQIAPPPPTEPRTTTCPDCAGIVSKRAVACPHCGARLAAANVIPSTPQVDYQAQMAHAYRAYPGPSLIFILIGMATTVNGLAGQLHLAVPFIGVMVMLFGLALLSSRYVNCGRCGRRGPAKVSGGSGGTAVVLLLLGIVPGILYMLLCPARYSCRFCGNDVK